MYHATLRTLWGLGKALGMGSEELHAVVYRETRKESMKMLTVAELDRLARVLGQMKDGVPAQQKRTDVGGNSTTTAQRRKIYMLTGTLGWNDDNRRISAFAKRITGVDRIEWLSTAQCNMVIEGLKDMVSRERRKCGT